MTVSPMAVDTSHWTVPTSFPTLKANGIVAVMCKATQGGSYHDPTYESQKAAALSAGLKWGAYHFGDSSDVQAQINNFLSFAAPDKDTLICLDWEDYQNVTMSVDQARAFMDGVEKALGRSTQCVLYSGNTAKEKITGADSFFGSRRLWLAQYGTAPTVQASWKSWWLWQYTDGVNGPQPHSIPGMGTGDISSYDGTPAQLADEWAAGIPSAAPATTVVTIRLTIPFGSKVEVTES